MFKLFIQLILFSIFLSFSSYSKNYEKIIVNGNERISNETILIFSEIQDSKVLDENYINEFNKFKSIKPRNIEEIHNLSDYVSLKIDTMSV